MTSLDMHNVSHIYTYIYIQSVHHSDTSTSLTTAKTVLKYSISDEFCPADFQKTIFRKISAYAFFSFFQRKREN